MSKERKKAAIFDMDGVLVVNMHIHEEAFYQFGRNHGIDITKEFFLTHITGSTNEQIMPKIFGKLTDEQIGTYATEKEELYRAMYAPQLKATDGLISFLDFLKAENVPMAIASNAPIENIRFVADALGFDEYIHVMLNGTMVAQPKPAPDMFLKAALLLGVEPSNCVVFEDAPGGIRAANAAGMRSVALLTSHTVEELPNADLYVSDFNTTALYDFWKAF